jgi:plastocyanin
MLFMPLRAPSRHFGTLLVVLALVMGIACGGSSGQPAGSIKVSMTEFAFAPKDISVPTGKVVLFLANAGQAPHDMVVLDSSGKQVAKSDLVQAGNDSLFTIDNLPAGTYTFVCDVQGHREAGMVGTLTVT